MITIWNNNGNWINSGWWNDVTGPLRYKNWEEKAILSTIILQQKHQPPLSLIEWDWNQTRHFSYVTIASVSYQITQNEYVMKRSSDDVSLRLAYQFHQDL